MFTAYFDGASEPNPGPSSIGAVIISPDGEKVWELSEHLGHRTNNEAEYMALIALLKELNTRGINHCEIKGDNQLVVNQVNGEWEVRKAHLFPLCAEAKSYMLKGYKLKWVTREQNQYADKLSKEALVQHSKTNERLSEASKKAAELAPPQEIFDGIFLVQSSCKEKVYAVDTENKACTCPAFVKGKTRPCKHMMAVEEHGLLKELSRVRSMQGQIKNIS
jgi:ribonuclease HI